ncbi:MAG TPA: hypothetical protein P5560_02280 [Thermotogota bacterium]|nr:hypothetical protein [Thermotogota bacterium]HRW91756.1 hypothetical protein [Thermotogota bacterium]
MKKSWIAAALLLIFLVPVAVLFSFRTLSMEIQTLDWVDEISFLTLGRPDPLVVVRAPKDDLFEKCWVQPFDVVNRGSLLATFERKEEEYLFASAKSEYARSLLNSGSAVQEEKFLALEVASSTLAMTRLYSPVEGIVLSVGFQDRLFVEKGTECFTILAQPFVFRVEVPAEYRERVESAEYVRVQIERLGVDMHVWEKKLEVEQGSFFFPVPQSRLQGKIPMAEEVVRLWVPLRVESVVWLPEKFLQQGNMVQLRDGRTKAVQIVEKQEGFFLVHGLQDGDIVVGRK